MSGECSKQLQQQTNQTNSANQPQHSSEAWKGGISNIYAGPERPGTQPASPCSLSARTARSCTVQPVPVLLLHVPSEHHRQPGLPGTDGQRVCASPCSPSAWMAQTQRPVTGTTRFAAPGLTQLHLRRSAWAPASSDQTPGQGNMQGNVQLHSSGSQPPPERAWLAGPAGGGVSDERRLPIADQ